MGPVMGVSALMVHSQVTLSAPCLRNTVTMCCHAATNAVGDVWP